MDKSGSVPKKYEHIDFKPPKSVAEAAKKGLEYREKASPSNKGGLTPAEAGELGIGSGVQRAVNLKNRDNVSPEVIKQMRGFLSRSEKSSKVSPENRDTPWNDKGYVAWLLWGGDPAKSWVEGVYDQMEKADANSSEGKEAKALVSRYTSELEGSVFWAETGMRTAVEALISYIGSKVPKKFIPELESLYPRLKKLHLDLVAISDAMRDRMRRKSRERDPEAEATARLETVDTGLRSSFENLTRARKSMDGGSQASAELDRVIKILREIMRDFGALKSEIEAYQKGIHPLDWLSEIGEEALRGLKFASETGDGSEHVGVFAPLPESLASQFPVKEEDKSRPHVTLYYIGPVPEREMQEVLVETLRDFYAEEPGPISARLSGVDYFRSPSGCVAYAGVVLSRDMGQMKDRVKAKLLERGLEFKDDHPLAFNPHVTLAYYDDPHAVWEGEVPVGSWTFDGVELWGLPEIHNFHLDGYLPVEKIGGAKKEAGWWKSKSEGVIGDGSADLMQDAVAKVRRVYREEVGREPTLAELWDNLEFVTGPDVKSKVIKRVGGGIEEAWGPTLVEMKEEAIPGGRARGMSPGDFDKSQIEMGVKVEQEHLESGGYSEEELKALATEIAMDHLAEIPDYYTRLKKMEDGATKNQVKTACIIAAGEFGGSMTLLKNRDRNYSPEVKVFHSVRNGVEILYMRDETTGWIEGINEYGIGIVNSALMVGHDEAEKKLVKTVGKKSKDGERILKALESKDVEEALESLKTNMGGVKGHTFVSDADGGYTLEMTSKHNPVVTPIGKEINVRTNHGIEYPDAGYTEGDDLVSSVARRETARKKLEGVESPRMVAPAVYGYRLKDLSDSNNMVRDTSNMRTVSQMVLDLKSKRMFLYLIPGKVRYLGFEDDLPEGHEPKLRFDLYKYTDIDGDGDFDIIKKQPKKVVTRADGKKASGGPDLEKVRRVNGERETRASLRAEWGEFKFGK